MKRLRNDVIVASGKDGVREGKKPGFAATSAAKKVLLSTLAAGAGVAACTPDINITNIPYDPDAVDGGTGGQCITSCEPVPGILREEGNAAGPNEMNVGNAILRVRGQLVDEGPTKAAKIQLEGCGGMAEDNLIPEELTTLTINDESVDVRVNEIRYDGAGARISVTATPMTNACIDQQDAGTGGDGGSGSG